MKLAFASDHAGFELKEIIKEYLNEKYRIEDFGCYTEERCDYPDLIVKAARSVAHGEADRALIFCGSGVGASITANKVHGVRCVLCFNEYIAEYSRLHNDTNALALAGRLLTPDIAKRLVDIWLTAPYEGGRHQGRLDKIHQIEKEECES
jgi:ribose 5-phosphate isomerase B